MSCVFASSRMEMQDILLSQLKFVIEWYSILHLSSADLRLERQTRDTGYEYQGTPAVVLMGFASALRKYFPEVEEFVLSLLLCVCVFVCARACVP